MKKNLLASYLDGIRDNGHGERYRTILGYFIPELVTTLMIIAPFAFDSYLVGLLKSTAVIGALGATKALLHFITKVAEAFSVVTVVLSGKHNGRSDFKEAGKTLSRAFWVTCFLGVVTTLVLYIGATTIYRFYVPAELVPLGASFLQLRAFGIFLLFTYYAFAGFLRGAKNTKTPMYIVMAGTVVFFFFDYVLILGKWGFPALGLQGSAIASIIQYAFMFTIAVLYVLFDEKYRKYGIQLFSMWQDKSELKEFFMISLPVIVDKAIVALAYIWMTAMVSPLGSCGVAAYCVVNELQRFALIPAVAFAQIITFLVSNDFGAQNWDNIKTNIKKVIFLAAAMAFAMVFLFMIYPSWFVGCYARTCEVIPLAVQMLPVVSILMFFDLLQLLLSAALRGAENVQVVMRVRLIVIIGFFLPVSFVIARLPLASVALKLSLVYGSFYIGNALMSAMFIKHLRSEGWKNPKL